jgi:predicted TIM-barrel fold metal-dependent hydrolase
MRAFRYLLLLLAAASAPERGPVVDHHQHLISPSIAALLSSGARSAPTISARQLVALLDSAGVQRALVLSLAYMYGSPTRTLDSEYAKVRAENDWTEMQAAQYPDRLRAFCSFNPLKDYAIGELERCAAKPDLHYGIKLHFGNSDVQLENQEHLEQLRRVFRAANQHRLAIVIHLHANIARHRPYGAIQARILLDSLLPLAPDVPVQIAHLAGSGGYSDPGADSVMAVLADAVAAHDPRTRRLWFDVTTVALPGMTDTVAALVVRRIRQVGVDRILYGSDAAVPGNLPPREGWAAFRKVPLTTAEFDRVAANVAPYMR